MREGKYPKGETVWARYYDSLNELRFIVTSKDGSRDVYFLYECVNGSCKKLGRAKNPKALEEKFGVNDMTSGDIHE